MKFSFLLAFVSLSLIGTAQSYTVTVSNEIALDKKSYVVDILPLSADEACMVTTQEGWGLVEFIENTYFNFFKFNKSSRIVPLSPVDEGAAYMTSYVNNGKLLYFDAAYDKAEDKIKVHLRMLDNNAKVTKSTEVVSAKVDKDYMRSLESIFKPRQSPNKTKLLLVSRFSDKAVKAPIKVYESRNEFFKYNSLEVGVIDENGDIFFKKTLSPDVPSSCEMISIESCELMDNGDVYLVAKEYIDGVKEKKEGKPNYKCFAYVITDKGQSFKRISLNAESYFLEHPELFISNKGNIYCAGLLSENNYEFAGIYALKLTAGVESGHATISKFNTEEVNKYNSNVKYKNDEINQYFVIDEILEFGDGIGISTEYYDKSLAVAASGNASSYYVLQDIVYYKLDGQMKLKDVYVIPKYQKGSSEFAHYFSYSIITHNDQPYFFFNDRAENVNVNGEKMKGVTLSSNMVPFMVFHNGKELVKKVLFDRAEVGGNVLRPEYVEQLDDNTVFLPFEKNGKYMMGKLVFTD